jgi:hypothetical protein
MRPGLLQFPLAAGDRAHINVAEVADVLPDNRSLPSLAPGSCAPRLVPTRAAFLPGYMNRTIGYDSGNMAYRLLQSAIANFHAVGADRPCPTARVGCGGRGALVCTGQPLA